MLRLPLLAFVMSLALLTGCGDSAETRSEGLADLQAIKKRWDDGVNVASSTSRIALSGPAMNLQQIRRDLDGVRTGECLAGAKSALAEGMDATISGVLRSMRDGYSSAHGFAAIFPAVQFEKTVSLCGMSEGDAQALAARQEQEAKARCQKSMQAYPAGKEFTDVLSGGGTSPAMVIVPCGAFIMGSSEDSNEQPLHAVLITKAFALSKHEVTFDAYDAFATATSSAKPDDEGWGRENLPVINVSWIDATAYAAWLSQQTGKKYRLPTEAEWEYAARAGSNTKYPWGDEVGVNRANCDGCGSQWDKTQTAPVGSFGPNAFGLYDMHGNVYEWVLDCHDYGYLHAPADGTAREQCYWWGRVIRSSSWLSDSTYMRSAARGLDDAKWLGKELGFRLARDLE